MSNASLKDQLQALTSNTFSADTKTVSSESTHAQKSKQKISWMEYAQYGVELLKAHYPLCFKEQGEIQPLKVGIKQDLLKQLSSRDDIVMSDKACMVSSLSFYVNSPSYHKCVVKDAARVDLDGNACGTVTETEAQYSDEYRKNKAQKRKSREFTRQQNSVDQT